MTVSKAIIVKINEAPFLVETDDSIEFPSDIAPAFYKRRVDSGNDFQEVVDLRGVEQSFADIKNLIVRCCNSLHDAIDDIPHPEKMAIEFGIKLVGETGFPMITKASGEANFKINIEWKGGAGSNTEAR
jgi:hypothetical protein